MVKFQIVFIGILLLLFSGVSLLAQDTASVLYEDTLSVETPRDSLSMADLLASDTTQARKKIKIIRRDYDFKSQVGSAVGMMLFIAIILMTVQNWNPK